MITTSTEDFERLAFEAVGKVFTFLGIRVWPLWIRGVKSEVRHDNRVGTLTIMCNAGKDWSKPFVIIVAIDAITELDNPVTIYEARRVYLKNWITDGVGASRMAFYFHLGRLTGIVGQYPWEWAPSESAFGYWSRVVGTWFRRRLLVFAR